MSDDYFWAPGEYARRRRRILKLVYSVPFNQKERLNFRRSHAKFKEARS